MLDTEKTKAQLIEELNALRARLEAAEPRQSERSLQGWIQRYELVVAASGQIAYEYDLATGNILWGATVERVLGYSTKEISGGFEQWMELLHPDDKEATLAYLGQAEAACSYWDACYRMRHKDGHYVWIRDRGFFVPDSSGRAALQLGMLEDVTERREAEEALAATRERADFFADLLERSSQPFTVGYPDGRLGYCNAAYAELVGYSRDELASVAWTNDLTPPEWSRAEREKLEELRRTGRPVRYEKEYIRKDGSRVPIELLVHLDRDERAQTRCYYAFITDITERKQAEKSLKDSEQRFRAITDGIPIPLLVIDQAHRVVAWNRALAEYTGLGGSEMIGSRLHWRAFYPAERPCMADLVVDGATGLAPMWYEAKWARSLLVEGAYEGTDYFPHMKNGRWLFFTAAPIADAQGQIAGAVETLQDITDRKQAEEALRQAVARSERDRAQLEAVFHAVTDGIVVSDMAGNFLLVNEAEAQIGGFDSPEELRRDISHLQSLFTLHYPDGRLVPLEDWPSSKVLRGESVANWELLGRRNDTGREWFFSFSAEPVRNEQGEQILAVIITRDITRQKQAEKALQASEASYRALVEQIPTVAYRAAVNVISATTYVSPRIERLIGYTPSQYLADPQLWNKLLHADDRERVLAEVARAQASGEPFASEYRMIARDGHTVWVRDEGTITRDSDGRPLSLQGVMSDITERKQAEQALRESEERFREVVENINEVLWLTDWVDRKLLYVSPSYETVYGRTRESCFKERRSWLEPIHPDDRDRIDRIFAEKGERGEYTEEEYRIVQPDGTIRWIRDRSFPIRAPDGSVCRWVGVAEDFTDRRLAEDALRQERDFAEGLIDTAQAIILVLDPQGRIVRFNPYLARISGYDLEEVRGASWFDTFLPESDRLQTRELFLKAIGDIQTRGNVNAILTKDGRLRWIEWYDKTLKDSDGRVVGLLALGQDITERRLVEEALQKAHNELEQRVQDRTAELRTANQRLQEEVKHREATEAALRDNRDLLQAVMDGINDVIFTKDLQGRYCLINAAIATLSAKAPEEIIGQASAAIFPPEEARRREEEDRIVIETKTAVHREMSLPLRGQPRHFLLSKMPRIDSRGEVVGIIGIARDITEFKQTQERLQRAEHLASIGTLAAGIAHEINNPIGAAFLAAQNALSYLEEGGDRHEVVKCLNDIMEDAGRCGQIARNLLRFAKQEPLEKEPAEMAVVLERAVELVRPLAEERGVTVELAVPSDSPRVLMNATALLQAIENVIRNGIQASDSDSRVHVGLECLGGEVRVVVRDVGCGLTTEQQAHMFDPFYTSRRREGGSGLGLSIVHGVVADHAGTIFVDSNRGHGTTVTLTLPRCP